MENVLAQLLRSNNGRIVIAVVDPGQSCAIRVEEFLWQGPGQVAVVNAYQFHLRTDRLVANLKPTAEEHVGVIAKGLVDAIKADTEGIAQLARVNLVFVEHQYKGQKCQRMEGMLVMLMQLYCPSAIVREIGTAIKTPIVGKGEHDILKERAIAAALPYLQEIGDQRTYGYLMQPRIKRDDVADTVCYLIAIRRIMCSLKFLLVK